MVLKLNGSVQDLVPGFLELNASHLDGRPAPSRGASGASHSRFCGHSADLCIGETEDLGHLPEGGPGAVVL